MDRRWISPRATADYLGCHLQTVYVWIVSGEIPSARIGRKVLVDRIRLDKRLEAQLDRQSQLRGRP
ncbi:helix-turn-helix domain-containing protein [Candidatus Bathyarchaeota archaeon]|nr:helix-turn-helix domain-containing protein [Candidatus Bathyarchaeota archaeon]